MIEQAIKTALERITGLLAYPLLLPKSATTGVTFQRISDPELHTGLVRSGVVEGRFQITLYVVDDFSQLVALDKAIWRDWHSIVHGNLEGYPVQYIERAGLQDSAIPLNDGSTLYRRARDYLITFSE
jgi:hypothetical protein